MKAWLRNTLVATAALSVGFGACGGSSETAGPTGSGGASATGVGNGGSTGVTLTTNGQGGSATVGVGSGGSSTGVGGGCAGESIKAELLPLDMYIMLDSSGSMTDKTGMMGNGVEKWSAITSALDSFFGASESDGIGVALQFFPMRKASVPETCSSNAECAPDGGLCVLKVCDDNFQACSTGGDCNGGASCIDVGHCANQTDTLCLPVGAFCNGNQGECVTATSSFCDDAYSCTTGDYATPAVPMATLGAAATNLNAAIAAKTPEGATPTSAALQGAIDYASGWAQTNPEHTVVAVLATDGAPTECDPLDADSIANIAAAGVALDPSVLTFVIGIVKPSDNAEKQAMNAIAEGGGTDKAFFVDPGGNNVDTGFLDALNQIRSAALACEYLIPQPAEGDTINYGQINVDHTPAGGNANTIFFVPSAGDCDMDTGGWYYDVDPAQGTPTKILACPSTCDDLKQGGQVDIVVGCDTIIAPPK